MVPMTRLTSVHGSFAAHVVAARLRAEGFDVDVSGGAGPYAVSVGELGRAELYVPADQVEAASLSLLAAEVEEALDDGADTPPTASTWPRCVSVLALLALAVAPLLRLLAVGD